MHAQYLFLLGQHANAQRMFTDLDKIAPEHFEKNASRAETIVSTLIGSMSGFVKSNQAGFAFLQTAPRQIDIYAPRALSEEDCWNSLYEGGEAQFDIRFNRRGPVAINIQPASRLPA